MTKQHPAAERARGRRPAAGIVGLAALVAVVALALSLYGIVRQSSQIGSEIQVVYVVAAGGGAVIAALVAFIRDMSALDVLEAVWGAIAAVFALIGALLKGIWNAILSLLGWD